MKKIFASVAVVAMSIHAIAQDSNSINTTGGFKKQVLTDDFISEGVAVGDVDHDGKTDILAGAEWFKAPSWERHAIDVPKTYKPGTEYGTSFLNYAIDVNLDGWIDLVVIGFPGTPATWYENPKNKPGYWPKHHGLAGGVGVGNESPNFVDVDGNGRLDILCADVKTKQIVWLSAPSRKGDTTWTRYAISATNAMATDRFSHGLGYGDINGDGRADVISKDGWWEAPDDRKQPDWKFHKATLGAECSQMYTYDVNADGLSDVISASAHHHGIWWHEQGRDAQGNAIFTWHEISKAFSQSHGVAFTDVNGDGYPDIITGKRRFAHNDSDTDPGTRDPSVIYWFEMKPGKQPQFIPHEIDADSGVGLNVVVQDMNKDKVPDIVIANKRGIFYFENLIKRKK